MMILFGATADIMDYSVTYTSITSLGFPFLILTVGGSNLIRADGSPRFSMLCTLTGAVINTILDPLFIFGFDMGMAGAALATIIGQIVSSIMVIVYFTRFKTVHLTLKSLIPSFKYCRGYCGARHGALLQPARHDGGTDCDEQHSAALRCPVELRQ